MTEPMTEPVVLVVEDALSEAALRKMVASANRNVERVICTRGNDQIKQGIEKFKNASKVFPHVVLTDLDRYPCAPALLEDWGATNLPPQLLFRIAVREVEAWLLADREGIADFLQIALSKVPQHPETESDPKQALVNLARKAKKKRLASEIVPPAGSRVPIGPFYNARMSEFANDQWNIQRACENSESLRRTMKRIFEFN